MHPRKFVRDAAGLAISQMVARATLLVRGVVAARALGPAGFGLWNALNLVLDYGTYASAGALQGLDLELPGAVQRGDRERQRTLLSGALSVLLLGWVSFAIVLAFYLASGPRAIERGVGTGPAALMLAAALLQLVFQLHGSTLRSRGGFAALSTAAGIQALIGGGLGLALVWRFGVWGLLAGWLAGGLVGLVVLHRSAPDVPLLPGAPAVGFRLARAGLPVFGFFVTSLILRSVDRLALVRFGSPQALGHYSLGLLAVALVLYLPESAGSVLFPRVAAAARGAGDRARTWDEVARAQRALVVTLPLPVALGMVWAGPLVSWLLPGFHEGLQALRTLALGGLLLAAGTVPGYFLLASGRAWTLFGLGALAAGFGAVLVFTVASRDPAPATVALAASAGYAAFAAALVAAASVALFADAPARARWTLASFVPAVWGGALALAACRLGAGEGAGAVWMRSLVVVAGYAPAFWLFGRGAGLKRLTHEWLAGRIVPVTGDPAGRPAS